MSDDRFDFTPDRQRQQVMAVAHLAMQAVRKHIPEALWKRATLDLCEALDAAGIDIITAEDRAKAGLEPRSAKGWTPTELQIMDAKRVEAMLGPIQPLIVPKGTTVI